MPMGSTYGKDLALAACYGDAKAAIWPDPVYLAFFFGDPTGGSAVELTGTGGIPRLSLANTGANFAAPATGLQTNSSLWSSPASTSAWAHDADYWAFFDALTLGNMLDTGAIVDSDGNPAVVSVVSAGIVIQVPVGNWQLIQS